MAKLDKSKVTTAEDITECLESTSDFSFELKCLRQLIQLGYQCEHGGSYIDPVTSKPRQFDIRATKFLNRSTHEHALLFAVECKCLHKSYPLIVMTVPRTKDEAYHHLAMVIGPIDNSDRVKIGSEQNRYPIVHHVKFSPYQTGQFVGKNCVQVGRDQVGAILAGDADVYEKWSQALSSAHDLIASVTDLMTYRVKGGSGLILPIVVVPDGMLWEVRYGSDGERLSDPVPVDRVSFFTAHEYKSPFRDCQTFILSHLEFVTSKGLAGLCRDIEEDGSDWLNSS